MPTKHRFSHDDNRDIRVSSSFLMSKKCKTEDFSVWRKKEKKQGLVLED